MGIWNPEEITLLYYSWIGCVLLLGEVGEAKLIANPTRVTTERIFIAFRLKK